MAARRKSRSRRRTPAPSRRPADPPAPVRTIEPRPVTPRLSEPPHSHIVCRNCGRIAAVELVNEEQQMLIALASRHPDGWSVDGIAFSLTGSCARCREGLGA